MSETARDPAAVVQHPPFGNYTVETCPSRSKHTPCPSGYIAWHEWAEAKEKTHEQTQCPTCGFWAIWKRRRRAARDPAAVVREALHPLDVRPVCRSCSAAHEALAALEQQLQQAQGDTSALSVQLDAWMANYDRVKARAERAEEALTTVLAECELSDRLAAIVLEALAAAGADTP